MARKERYLVGLDVGTSKITAIVGETTEDGGLDIIGIGLADSKGMWFHHMLRGRIGEARAAVLPGRRGRDRLFATALQVGLSRRGSDLVGLRSAWPDACQALIGQPVDLFTLLERPGRVSDVAAHGNYAYLGAFYEPDCAEPGGVFVIDISNNGGATWLNPTAIQAPRLARFNATVAF